MDINDLLKKWSEQAENMRIFHMQELKENGSEWKKLLQENLKSCKGKKVLDAGCGTGFLAILLAQDGWEVTAIDSSEAMLEEGKKTAEELGLSDKITFLLKDTHSTGFPERLFDAVVSRHASWLFTSPETVYKEWKRVLKPEGIMLNIDANWLKPIWNADEFEKFKSYEAELVKQYGEFRDYYHDEQIINILKKFPLAYINRPEWDEKMLKKIGFKEIATSILSKEKYMDAFQAARYKTIPMFVIKAKNIEK